MASAGSSTWADHDVAYDPELADRIHDVLVGEPGLTEQPMFGGVAYMLDGNVCVGIWHDELIARLGVEAAEQALREDGVREFDITGRPMRGWVLVAPERLTGRGLRTWVDRARRFVRTLPPKGGGRGRPL
jgi:TfoX N-terminal domain